MKDFVEDFAGESNVKELLEDIKSEAFNLSQVGETFTDESNSGRITERLYPYRDGKIKKQ